MKRTLLFFATLALCAVSCGTVGSYADSDRFQDGIYYKPDPTNKVREPLSEDDFRYLASLQIPDQVGDDTTAVISGSTDYYSYPYGYWRPYSWHYYSHWGYYSYWGSPYYWGYDPYWWDYGWYGYPYYYGYPYHYGWGYPYHRYYGGYYGWRDSGTRYRREGSATSGHYSRPGSYGGPGVRRTASSMAQRDIDRIKVHRGGPKSTAVNREGYSETGNYRSATATRSNSSASYKSSSSSRSVSSSRSSGYSGGGHSSSSSHSSHSSGGGGYHGGGHR